MLIFLALYRWVRSDACVALFQVRRICNAAYFRCGEAHPHEVPGCGLLQPRGPAAGKCSLPVRVRISLCRRKNSCATVPLTKVSAHGLPRLISTADSQVGTQRPENYFFQDPRSKKRCHDLKEIWNNFFLCQESDSKNSLGKSPAAHWMNSLFRKERKNRLPNLSLKKRVTSLLPCIFTLIQTYLQ